MKVPNRRWRPMGRRPRLAACSWRCAKQTLSLMNEEPPQSEQGNYSVVRRYMASDSILRVDSLVGGD